MSRGLKGFASCIQISPAYPLHLSLILPQQTWDRSEPYVSKARTQLVVKLSAPALAHEPKRNRESNEGRAGETL
ncbi:hypothetical protein EYF80_001909 [Liparis tanakae]|uniref:Uncharacterized protein n=1 Tax=Liparis tanakae TaxID=230148 RepID=A0A4Z2JCB1_9TELE|nr:hypothetical protein EYF80_001909 [Liparis tanakae]